MEAETSVLEAPGRLLDSTSDINRILAEAAVKSTDEYRKGYEDGQNDAIQAIEKAARKQADTFFREAVEPAEVFYAMLVELIPSKNIKQYRIGLDYTTATPTVFVVISRECEDRLYDIEQAAAKFDVFMFQQFQCLCSFWVTTDDGLDQDLINRDFPWSKRGL